MSWDNEKTLSFIKEYEKRPILWKKSEKLYYNIVKKEDAWREISEIFDEDISVLKKKINSVRGSRRREKSRVLQSKRTGKGWADVYISKWFASDALKFLEDPEQIRTTISNYSEEEVTEEDPVENAEPKEAADDLRWNSDESNDDLVKENNEVNNTSNPPEKKCVSPKSLTPKRKLSEDPRIKEAFNILQNTIMTDRKKDECSIFGEYIAAKLRKHDNRTRMILQHQIHNLLFQAEMNTE